MRPSSVAEADPQPLDARPADDLVVPGFDPGFAGHAWTTIW
jgi:hypothetical protein